MAYFPCVSVNMVVVGGQMVGLPRYVSQCPNLDLICCLKAQTWGQHPLDGIVNLYTFQH